MQAEFGMLGSLRVRADGAVFGVPAARQRVVLAALAVRARRPVSFEELAGAIWDGEPPGRPRVVVRNYVSRLRQALGPVGGRIVTCAPGYLLEADDDEVDVLAFTRLCRDGGAALRAGAWPRAWDVLAEALGLWRGTPLADVPSRVLRDEHVPVLESLRLQAAEWRLEAGLQLGRHSELVPELQALAREHPLRERFREQLMLALHRCGRPGEALAVYTGARRALVDELGIEPGPDLRRLQQRILAADPALLQLTPPAGPGAAGAGQDGTARAPEPGSAAPHQLPAGLRYFAGRRDELAALTRVMGEVARPGGTMVISAIDGTAGVGKTALAVHWAHQVAGEFPDGQLYVNLRGFDPSGAPVTPEGAIRDFLDALGTPPERIPPSPSAQAALYRTLLAGRRLLILLDNARDAEQVRPLLPGAPGCLVLVTSRSTLASLAAADGAHLLALDRPGPAEARALLAGRLGTARLAAEPAAADELIELCARLPLALSIAAAQVAARPRFPLAALAASLRDAGGRLEVLDAGSAASSVRAVFSWSYRQLSPPAAGLFRLLGLCPGPDLSAPAAASLAGLPLPAARAALYELLQANLIAELAPARYGLHDLLRIYAASQAEARDAGEQRRAATHRILDHYLYTAAAAARALDPSHEALADGDPQPGVTPEPVADREQALAWFTAEHKVLLAAARQAASGDFSRHARKLPWTMVTFLDRRGHWHDLVTSQHTALAAAERAGDLDGQARTHRNLARALIRLGQAGQALTHLARATELSRRLGDLAGEARAHLSRSVVFEGEHQPAESLACSLRALELAQAARSPILHATACNNVGYGYATLGDFSRALSYCQRALDLSRQVDSPSLTASVFDSLGYTYHHLGDYQQATANYLQALALFRALGARRQSADTLTHLGDTHQAAGSPAAARDAWQQALALLTDLHAPDTAQIRTKLQSLTHPPSPAGTP